MKTITTLEGESISSKNPWDKPLVTEIDDEVINGGTWAGGAESAASHS